MAIETLIIVFFFLTCKLFFGEISPLEKRVLDKGEFKKIMKQIFTML
jgi:hypothetical protein